MRRTRLFMLVLSVLIAAPAFADSDPNVRRGIAPGNTYRSFDIDTINQFNGSLVLRIPIAEAPVGPFLSQSLQLTYNSSIYDYQVLNYRNVPDEEGTDYKRRAIPEVFSNSGLGWSLSLGRLVAPRQGTPVTPDRGWHYRSPTGSEHDFTLGIGDVAEAVTRDGSFLRLKRTPSDINQPVTYREIEFGDGTIHRFNPSGDLTQIRDRVGHTIEIDYSDPMKWVITNEYNGTTFRTTTVNFVNRTAPVGYAYEPNFQKVVSSIEIPAFNGTIATYQLIYQDTVLPRDGCGDRVDFDPPTFAAPLLTEIQLPEDLKYGFTYYSSAGQSCTAGIVKSAKLPSQGSIEWTFQSYKLSQADCDDEHGWVVRVPGIRKRILKDAAGTTVGEWAYETDIDLNPGTPVACGAFEGRNFPYGLPPNEITTTVTASEMRDGALTPVDGKTIHYYAGRMNGMGYGANSNKPEEYGLPFTRRVPHSSNTNRFLSTERYDAGNTLVRSRYLTYKADAALWDDRLANTRVQGELTVFNGDTGCNGAACRIDVDRPEADYDQYGHYRKTVTTSNFGTTRTTFTNYTPSTNPWILGTYDSAWAEEGGVAKKQLFAFDSNGVMRTRRTLVGSAATAGAISTHATKDLLEVFCRDARGFLTSERFFGGDGATAFIPTGDPCSATPAATEYRIDHQFTFNTNNAPTKHTAKYKDMPFFIADDDLDVNTGLVSTSRDVSGLSTTFTYDLLGRPEEVKPTGTAWTLYEYTNASGTTTPASLRVTTRANGTTSSATPLSDAYLYYDWKGRLIQTKQKSVSDSGTMWTTGNTVYDLFNRATKVSVPEFRSSGSFESAFAPAKSTVTTFDVFGRPLSVVGPDDKTRSTSYTGQGVREMSTTAQIALPSGLSDVTTTAKHDAYGRLLEIGEPNGIKTQYKYGLTGLSKVCQNTTDNGTTCGQERTFTRDNRGFLTSESHVENEAFNYAYDARGNVLTKGISGNTQSEANLKFTYDSAERLTEIQTHHPTLNSYRSGKVFEFGTANTGVNGTNRKLGKLTSASRYNYAVGTVVVKESFDYEDPAGRLSRTVTEIKKDGVVLQTLEQGQTYATNGLVGTIQYPTCITVACGSAAWNTTALGYTNGFLTSVQRFADAISYNPSGSVSKVDHAGPVTDTYTPDETGVRPKSITFEGYSDCTAPTITTGTPADRSIAPGQTATLTVTATNATSYQWYEGNGSPIAGQTSVSYTTPALSSTKTYYVRVSSACATVTSRTATVTVLSLSAPTGLTATANGTSSATISWNASAGADHYIVERKSNGSAFVTARTVYGTSVTDSGLVANRSYVYRVRAVSPDESVSSGPSNVDLATTMVFAPLAAGHPLLAARFDELLTAVNAVRAANGASALSWSSILPSGMPGPAPGVRVQGQHILAVRSAMNSARAALGLSALSFTNSTLSGIPIRPVHLIEVRGGVE